MTLRDHGRALALALAGLAIRLDALRSPPVSDDHAQLAMLRGDFPVRRAAWDLFAFVRPGEAPALRDQGLLPWWTDDRFAIAMFRPLSSLALAAELSLGGGALGHAVSALLFVGIVLAAGALFRATLPRTAAWTATLLLALTPSATLPLLWLANQNALLSVLLGLLALVALRRDREPAAHAALLLASLAGEYGIPAAAYAVAFSVRPGAPLRRPITLGLAALLPALLGRALHYGAAGTDQYLDPLTSPARWLIQAPLRAILLAGTALFGQSTGAPLHGEVFPYSVGLTFVGAVALLVVFARTVRPWSDDHRRAAFSWAAAAALALAPLTSAPALPRLLLACAPGVAALLGCLCTVLGEGRRSRVALAFGAALLALHVAAVPWCIHRDVARLAATFARPREAAAAAAPGVSPAARCDVLFDALDLESLHYPPMIWREHGARPSPCWRVLSSSPWPVEVRHFDDRSILVRSVGGVLVVSLALSAYRARPASLGERIVTPSMTITVLAVRDGMPEAVRLDLTDDPASYAWWAMLRGRMVRVTIPARGGALTVPSPL